MRLPALLLLAASVTHAQASPGEASAAVSEASVGGSSLLVEGVGNLVSAGGELVLGAVTLGAGTASVTIAVAGSATQAVVLVPIEIGRAVTGSVGASVEQRPCPGGSLLRVDGHDLAFVPDAGTRSRMHTEQVR
ncbi:MAG: hypothetical protein IPK97_07835 [Ahniella sp.]|nr:hypothetical protein [Ahniella sp.]